MILEHYEAKTTAGLSETNRNIDKLNSIVIEMNKAVVQMILYITGIKIQT
jgi:hypothetical protein